jgi:PhnB protein
MSQVQPYLFFNGRCDEAIDFYSRAIGAEVQMLMRFKDAPAEAKCDQMPPGTADKVMHAALKIGETQVLTSDGQCQGNPSFQGFGLALSASNEAEADRLFNALSDGGKVQMPIGKTFFSPRFGMVADKFGVLWMVLVGQG